MKRPTISSAIDPKKLSAAEKDQLANNLFQVHNAIFDGVSKDAFQQYVLEAPTKRSRIFTFHNKAGNTVGYITHQQYGVKINGRKRNIYRTEVGLKPEYRGCNSASMILFREMLKAYFRTGFRRAWFVATPIHPNPYCIAVQHLHSIYPHPDRPMDDKKRKLMRGIADATNLEPGAPDLPLQKKVGWITKESPSKRIAILNSKDESVQYYLSQNPDYHLGKGMMMVIPVSVRNGLSMLKTFARRKIRKAFAAKKRQQQSSQVLRQVQI